MTWMTWRDTLELGLKEDARTARTTCRKVEIRGREIPMGRGDGNYCSSLSLSKTSKNRTTTSAGYAA